MALGESLQIACAAAERRLDEQVAVVLPTPPDHRGASGVDPMAIGALTLDIQQRLLQGLGDRAQFSGLRDYVVASMPTPPPPDSLDPIFRAPRLSLDAARRYAILLRDFLHRLSALQPLALDVLVTTEPADADIEMRTTAVAVPASRTNTVLKNVYRGTYFVKITKPRFKDATLTLNLVDDSRPMLECSLARISDADNQSSCRRR